MRFFLSAMTMFILQKTVNLTPNLLAGEKLFFVGKSFDNDQHQFRWIIGIDLSSSLLPRIIQCNIVCVYSSLNEGNENVSSLAKVNGTWCEKENQYFLLKTLSTPSTCSAQW